MIRKIGFLVLLFSSLAAGIARAAPCPNLVGTWQINLQCVRVDTNPSPPPATVPVFGTLAIQGIVAQQQGCAFVGDLGSFGPNSWVGVLSGTGGSTVNFNWFGAVGTGEVASNHKSMALTYTFSATGQPTTACTGVGVKQ
jgi:hypothetical protein